jgi:transketolase
MGNLQDKFEAFGWKVISIENGNDISSIIEGMKQAKSETNKGKPICVLLHTEMGNGVDFMMHTHAWHGKAPNDDQLSQALKQNPETLGDY